MISAGENNENDQEYQNHRINRPVFILATTRFNCRGTSFTYQHDMGRGGNLTGILHPKVDTTLHTLSHM